MSGFGEGLDRFALEQCKAFWNDRCESWAPVNSSELKNITNTAVALFQRAAHLAIYLQGLRVEYEWEQVNRLQSTPITKKDDEIIGTFGPDPTKDHGYEFAFVVFGGVARGDKATGLLANGRVRLVKNQIVIQERAP